MERRNFLKGAVGLSSLGLMSPVWAELRKKDISASVDADSRRRFVMTQTYRLKAPAGSEGKANYKALRSTDGVIKAKASLKTHQAEVIVPQGFDNQTLLTAISRTGYRGEIQDVVLVP